MLLAPGRSPTIAERSTIKFKWVTTYLLHIMFDISKIQEQHPWALNSCYNSNIDFCVWILQVNGLQFSPFNHHSFSNQVVPQAGLDVQGWYN
jgi:hypothetical protein